MLTGLRSMVILYFESVRDFGRSCDATCHYFVALGINISYCTSLTVHSFKNFFSSAEYLRTVYIVLHGRYVRRPFVFYPESKHVSVPFKMCLHSFTPHFRHAFIFLVYVGVWTFSSILCCAWSPNCEDLRSSSLLFS